MASNTRTVKSDERLIQIIEYLQEEDGAGVTEIANQIGMAKSTVHGHLQTLKESGYVTKVDREYQIGLQFFNHGIYARRKKPIYPLAKRKVIQVAQETGERAWCTVEENGLGYYLYGAEGEHPIRPPVRVGQSIPLNQTAGGKAILAHLPEEKIQDIVETHGLPAKTKYTITDEAELHEELGRIRDQGYATNKQESLIGLQAIGVSIIDESGAVQGALSISAPHNRLENQELKERFLDLLRGETNEMAINVSYKTEQYATPVKKRDR